MIWMKKLKYPSEFKSWEFGKVGARIFRQALVPAPKQPLLANRGDAGGWKRRDASKAENQFLILLGY